MSIPAPWGAYIAGHPSNTSTSLYDFTGNGRNATMSGITNAYGSGNGASASVPFITGTASSNITWPAGSVPATFTICSISRTLSTNSTYGRVIDFSGTNGIWGHGSGIAGIVYLNGAAYQTNQTSVLNTFGTGNYQNWLLMCGTNSSSNTTPANYLANGTSVGVANNGYTGTAYQFTINNGDARTYAAPFSFQQVVIWNTALTNAQIKTVSDLMTNYLATGSITYPWAGGPTFSPYTKNINNSNLLYYYPLDVDLLDYASGTGVSDASSTAVSISSATTKLTSGAVLFPGASNETFKVPNTTFSTNGVTFSVWMKCNAAPSNTHRIFDFGSGAAQYNVWLGFTDGSGTLSLTIYTAPSVGITYPITYTLADLNWHHYLVSFSSSNVCSVYVDGLLKTTITGYPSTTTLTSCLLGTSNWASDISANGSINARFNQFLVFNRQLTSNEISLLVNYPDRISLSGVTSATYTPPIYVSNANLMYYYPFDTNPLNYASGNSVLDGSATNVSISTTTSKLTNGSFYFTGASNEAFLIPNATFNANGITVMFWAKLNALNPSSMVRIFDFGSSIGTYEFAGMFSNNQPLLGVRGGYVSSAIGRNGNAYTTSDTNWHHYCITMSSFPQIVFYVDGFQVCNSPNSTYPNLTTLSPCYIGRHSDDGNVYLNAYLNQFIMFNRVLSYSEIYSIYSNPTGFQFISAAAPTPALPLGSPLIINNTRLLAYYPLDVDVLDYTTGTGVNNTTLTNASISTANTVMTSGSLYFSGVTTQALNIKSITLDGSGVTIAFWMKIVKIPLTGMTIIELNGPNGANISINCSSAGNLTLSMGSPSIQNRNTSYGFNLLNDINWHHYCITVLSNGFIYVYIDNRDAFFANYVLLYPALTTYNNCLIGASSSSSNNTNYGTPNIYMNQFLVYNRIITKPELFAIASFPGYVTTSSSASNIQTYYDNYTTTQNILYGSPVTVNVKYNSQFLNPGTTYSLKNSVFTAYGSSAIYNNCDGSFSNPYRIYALTVDSCGNIYIGCDKGSNYTSVFGYNINGTLVKTIAFRIGYGINCMTYDSSANLIYCGKNYYATTPIFGILNPSTSTITDVSLVSGVTSGLNQFAMSPSGVLYGTSSAGHCTINTTTGVGTSVYDSTLYPGTGYSYANTGFIGLTVDGSGNIYASTIYDIIYKYKPDYSYIYTFAGVPSRRLACDTSTGILYGIDFNQTIPGGIYKILPSGAYSLFSVLPNNDLAYEICYDKYTNRLYVAGSYTVYRFNLQNTNQVNYTFSSSTLSYGNNTLGLYDSTNTQFGIPVVINVTCFREGTLIRCLDASLKREVYVRVEHLTKDTFVITKNSGPKLVEVIGHSTIYNPNADTEIDNRLFVYRAGEKNPALFLDLYITGNHCALVKELPNDLKTRVREHMGDVYETEGHYRLPACLDERAKAFVEPGEYRIWHFALEHDDVFANYGVLANGLWVESASIDYLQNHSKMELV